MITDELKAELAMLLRDFVAAAEKRGLVDAVSFALAVRVDDCVYAKASGNPSVEFTATAAYSHITKTTLTPSNKSV